MKAGQEISYIDADGQSHTAYVNAVVGAGESGYKVLDVDLTDGRRFFGVPNVRDRKGAGCWVLVGNEPEVAEPVAEPAPEPVVEAPKRRGRPPKK